MKNSICLLLIVLSFSACLSDTERQGIHEISQLYGCQVSFSKGIAASTEKATKKILEVNLSGGESLNVLEPQNVACNAATIIFDHLNEEERESYTHVACTINSMSEEGSSNVKVEFSVQDLKIYSEKKHLFQSCYNVLSEGSYDQLNEMLAEQINKEMDFSVFTSYLDSIENTYGVVTGRAILGIGTILIDDISYLEISGIVIREMGNEHLSVVVSLEDGDDKIYGLNF